MSLKGTEILTVSIPYSLAVEIEDGRREAGLSRSEFVTSQLKMSLLKEGE